MSYCKTGFRLTVCQRNNAVAANLSWSKGARTTLHNSHFLDSYIHEHSICIGTAFRH